MRPRLHGVRRPTWFEFKILFQRDDANVKLAIRWVKTHSDDYGIDPDRLGMVGASAGGHLASLAALTPEKGAADTSVAAVVAFFPPADFLKWGELEVTLRAGRL